MFWCALLSGCHGNSPHSTLAFSPFTPVLGMRIRVCPIVTPSSCHRSSQSLPLAPSDPSAIYPPSVLLEALCPTRYV
ncbi:unnamed protein product [Protopolystoma xenopodis]|uniref:Uncharacterized protein n=1 Tax=Protopolystoma xenopodis TaxID=117903 RepID=A0A3S5BJM6_9PLAT|nr:unnamed protein product [Protopolystoma xenopodis]